jgi:hypothetical protein
MRKDSGFDSTRKRDAYGSDELGSFGVSLPHLTCLTTTAGCE